MDSRRAVAAAAVVVMTSGCSGSVEHTDAATHPVVVTTSTSSTSTSTTTSTSTSSTTVARTTTTITPTTVAAKPVAIAPACPTSLAGELTRTGSARQLITVEAAGWGTTYAQVELWQKSGNCWVAVAGPWSARIGANGFSNDHREGDNTTPTGLYGVGAVMYGDAPNPGVHESYVNLVCGDWWDEDPTSKEYNTFQYVPCGQQPSFGGGSEPLWEETQPYPSFAVVDYNTDPIIPYNGSAIFFHADTGSATAGCVSVPLSDLDYALDWIEPSLQPAFVMGPAQEITSF